ncbi:MAG: cyclase family protein, partial [Dehalococcoidia bacterium]
GLMNLQTPERVLAAARLIRKGTVFPLNASLNQPAPPMFGRGAVRRTNLSTPGGRGFDDVLDNFFPQASSQWDSLGHVGFKDDTFYNGVSWDDVNSGRRNTIEHWARKGIAGRAVLLDAQRALQEAGQPFDPSSDFQIGVDALELTRRKAAVEFQPGDIVLLRTGFGAWYQEQDLATRRRLASTALLQSAGIEHSEAMARYIWNSHASGWASDCPSLEAWPPAFTPDAWPFGFLHNMLIGQFGLAIGELWSLDDLAADCAADGVYEMFFTSAPLNATGGIGSPPNALAIK